MEHYRHSIIKTSELTNYKNNARTHSAEQISQIADSIKKLGFTNPLLIRPDKSLIAGHGRLEAARSLGIDDLPCITVTGLSNSELQALVIVDNQLALNAGWDMDILRCEIEGLKAVSFDIDILGFDNDFLEMLEFGDGGDEDDDLYTANIEAPIYEPSETKPAIADLYDTGKSDELIQEIEAKDLPEPVKNMLIHAAQRHTVFDFSKAADYYAQSSPDVQDLMERSAMIVIDYDKAIEYGFITVSNRLKELYKEDGEPNDA